MASALGLCITVRGSRKTWGPRMDENTRELVGRRGKNEPLVRPEDAAGPGSRDGFRESAEFWFLAVGVPDAHGRAGCRTARWRARRCAPATYGLAPRKVRSENRAIIVERTVAAEELDGMEKLLDRRICSGAFHKAIVPKHLTRRVRRFRDAVRNNDQMVAGLHAGLSAGVVRL